MGHILADHHTWEYLGFILVVGLLLWKGVPGLVGKMLDERAAVIAAELDEAKRLRAEAAVLLADYQNRAAGAEADDDVDTLALIEVLRLGGRADEAQAQHAGERRQ